MKDKASRCNFFHWELMQPNEKWALGIAKNCDNKLAKHSQNKLIQIGITKHTQRRLMIPFSPFPWQDGGVAVIEDSILDVLKEANKPRVSRGRFS